MAALFYAAAALASTAVYADDTRSRDPRGLLRRMLHAEERQAVAGREVTLLAGGRQSEQLIKRDPKRGLRMEFLNPDGDLLIDNYKRSWFVSRRRNRFVERESRLAELRQATRDVVGRIERGELEARWDGQDVVADRAADIVRVSPTDAGDRSSRRFWIDRQAGLRLKAEEIGPRGRVFSTSYFLTVDLTPALSPGDFAPPVPAPGMKVIREERRTFRTLADAQRAAGFPVRRPAYVPPGFTLRLVSLTSFRGEPVVAQRYTNGLSVFTLFQSRADPPAHELGKRRPGRGPRVLSGRDSNGVGFLLIGGLPDDEMSRIADSLR